MQARPLILGLAAAALALSAAVYIPVPDAGSAGHDRWRTVLADAGNSVPMIVAPSRGTRSDAAGPFAEELLRNQTAYVRRPAPPV